MIINSMTELNDFPSLISNGNAELRQLARTIVEEAGSFGLHTYGEARSAVNDGKAVCDAARSISFLGDLASVHVRGSAVIDMLDQAAERIFSTSQERARIPVSVQREQALWSLALTHTGGRGAYLEKDVSECIVDEAVVSAIPNRGVTSSQRPIDGHEHH